MDNISVMACYLKRMVQQVQNFVAQECSRHVLNMLRNGKLLKETVTELTVQDSYYGNLQDISGPSETILTNKIFWTWNDMVGFMTTATVNTGNFLRDLIKRVQDDLNIRGRTILGAIEALKEIRFQIPFSAIEKEPDQRTTLAMIDTVFPPNRKLTRSDNEGLRSLYIIYQKLLSEKNIKL